MRKILLFLLALAPGAHAADDHSPAADSARLHQAALEQIQWTIDTQDKVTDCSIYVSRVLARAGMKVGGFSSNNFDRVMEKHLPKWRWRDFSTDNPGADQKPLLDFLNDSADGTVFLARWTRVNESGHTALVEKLSPGHFVIYQAQKDLSLPHAAPAKVSQLLYAPRAGAGGGRAHLRMYYE